MPTYHNLSFSAEMSVSDKHHIERVAHVQFNITMKVMLLYYKLVKAHNMYM